MFSRQPKKKNNVKSYLHYTHPREDCSYVVVLVFCRRYDQNLSRECNSRTLQNHAQNLSLNRVREPTHQIKMQCKFISFDC